MKAGVSLIFYWLCSMLIHICGLRWSFVLNLIKVLFFFSFIHNSQNHNIKTRMQLTSANVFLKLCRLCRCGVSMTGTLAETAKRHKLYDHSMTLTLFNPMCKAPCCVPYILWTHLMLKISNLFSFCFFVFYQFF